MGNAESNVTSGVKKQADTSSIKIYKLVDLKGGGLLVEMMKRAAQSKQYAELDHAIKTKVEPFLYNKGQGKLMPISQLVLMRNKERPRHKMLPPLKNLENPDDYDIESYPAPESKIGDKLDKSRCRHVCWDLKERGAVGETILHLCLLNATSIHADLAKRLLRFYPMLINDIYMSDEYYGENVLHIAIVNEDPAMVKFLLDSGANFHERCVGNFMCPEDQKASRTDSLEHEWVNLCPFTTYEGYVYWGEYPLSFAACLGQEECYRLMLARGANPNNQDTNGNTVLHMLVIYSKLTTFDMAYEVGGDLSIRNVQNLTPLTLAAKLARIDLFFHILNIEREIYWQIGSITCAAYPLSQIDTIDIDTGNISKNSALNLVVFGEKDEHLELMDGVLIDLLNAKWNAFVKNRPGPPPPKPPTTTAPRATNVTDQAGLNTTDTTSFYPYNVSTVPPLTSTDANSTEINESRKTYLLKKKEVNSLVDRKENEQIPILCLEGLVTQKCEENSGVVKGKGAKAGTFNSSFFKKGHGRVEQWFEDWQKCRLLQVSDIEDVIRLTTEVMLEIGAILYIVAALREARFLGWSMFVENLMTAPSRVMFLFSCLLMMFMPFLRFSCNERIEDIMAVVIMLTTAPYFLFFCRGFKTVGPFVVMIYRMIMGDLLRFATIYLVFVMGFAQAYYIIFLSFDNPNTPEGVDDSVSNPIPNPVEAVMAMFFMSMTSFGDYYPAMEKTDHEFGAKLCFVIYMAIVAILLVNMLIAMMGNTYQKIAETRNEWQRQWARIVLVVERGVSPSERLTKLMWYSQPMSDGRRALVLRLNQSEEDKEEMKEILEMKRIHNRMVAKRKQREEELRAREANGPEHPQFSTNSNMDKLIDMKSPLGRKSNLSTTAQFNDMEKRKNLINLS
ncbi:transient receptor potential cation channel subfamily V member nanchung isoform X2 [Rhodnius prolixus]|uniref:transient receptor potential cation channel subfamily V member nanchung isoform X2 n=1 Tax=Rhodnius prolixus TaxID=13249 RepID=UPI003D18B87A